MKMFKLMQLPELARRRVILVMRPSEVFILSLFFRKFCKIAKSIRWNTTKMIIKMDEIPAKCTLFLNINNASRVRIISWRCAFVDSRGGVNTRHTINGTGIDCLFLNDRQRAMEVVCSKHLIDFLSLALQDHCYDVFGTPTDTSLRVDPSKISEDNYAPALKPIKSLIIAQAQNRNSISAAFLNNIFGKNQVEEYAFLGGIIEGNLENDHDILAVDNISFIQSSWITADHLLNLNGKDVMLSGCNFQTPDLINFLEHWFNGTNTKLDSLMILSLEYNLEECLRQILASFVWRWWSEQRRVWRYVTQTEGRIFTREMEDYLDCRNALDIQRRDGLLASIRLSETSFCFYVWKNRFPVVPDPIPYTTIEEIQRQRQW